MSILGSDEERLKTAESVCACLVERSSGQRSRDTRSYDILDVLNQKGESGLEVVYVYRTKDV